MNLLSDKELLNSILTPALKRITIKLMVYLLGVYTMAFIYDAMSSGRSAKSALH
jgi:hypothetical protein